MSSGLRGIGSFQAFAIAALGALSVSAVALGLQASARRSDREAAIALSNVKQATIGALLYCADYDDVYPYAQSTETAKSVMYPYVKNKSIYTSPTKGGRIIYNLNIGGVVAEEIPRLEETPVWVEQLPKPFDPAVGYADGHASLVKQAGRARLAAALKKKLPRHKNSKPLPKNYRPF